MSQWRRDHRASAGRASLAGESASALEAIRMSPSGDALSWPSLDVDVYVPGFPSSVAASSAINGPVTDPARIRVVRVTDGAVQDSSDVDFRIR